MSKVALNNITGGYAAVDLLNENFDAISAAFDNTLSRDGSTPNTWLANQDANHKRLLNVADPVDGKDAANKDYVINAVVDATPIAFDRAAYHVDRFTGDGSDVSFELSAAPGTQSNSQVYINGAYQNKNTYAVSGTTLTFTEAPPLFASIEVFVVEPLQVAVADAANVTYAPGGGGVQTTVESKLRENVSVKDFGAVGDGTTDDTAAIQAAIDYAATIVTDGAGDVDQVTAAVHFPNGKYRTTAAIQMKNCVQLKGDGSGSTWIYVDHAGNGFYTAGSAATYANIQVYGLHLESAGSAQDGFLIQGQIRNCYYHDVGCRGFRYSFKLDYTWTTKFDQCYSYSCVSHFYCTDVGGVHIYGGRYDVASDHGIYVDAGAAELIVTDAAIQFGNKSAVYVKNCYTVELNQCFLEGNCIGSTSDYYVYINRDTTYPLTSASVINCVINNRGDSNRNGLGALYIANIENFTYRERWVRNGVSEVPILGSNVVHANVSFNNAGSRSSVLTNVAIASNANAVVSQVARPHGIFGQDMADVSFAPTTRAALNVGFNSVGVAIGTYNSHPALNGYGDSFNLKLNPAGGTVYLGQTDFAYIEAGTNEYFGRYREKTQAASTGLVPDKETGFITMDCSGGNKNVTLTNITAEYGRRVTIVKNDGGSNLLTVTPATGETINGAATWTSTAAYASVSLIGSNGKWIIV